MIVSLAMPVSTLTLPIHASASEYCFLVFAAETQRWLSTLEASIYVRRELKRQRIGQQLGLAALCHPSVKARGTRTIVVEVHHNVSTTTRVPARALTCLQNGCASGAVLKAGFEPRVRLVW